MRLDLNSNKLLLQGSDDPLISHGASNDILHDEDQDYPFKTLLARKTLEEPQAVQHGACSILTKQQLKANLMNARKTHRQPQMPQELSPPPTQRLSRPSKSKKRSAPAGAIKLRFHHQALPAEYAAHYEATQRRQLTNTRPVLAAPAVKATAPPQNQSHENVRSWLRKIAEIQRSAERQQQAQESFKASAPTRVESTTPLEPVVEPVTSSKRTPIKYADLPYMGEITLDNYKPRRGRKPKKADICHLIYKNYGTIIPANQQHFPVVEPKHLAAPTGVTALLPAQRVVSSRISTTLFEEPLNLCLRDQSSDRYSISSGSDSDKPSTVTIATTSTTECGSSSHRATPLAEDHTLVRQPASKTSVETQPRIAAKVMLQPVGLYYQQLMENCRLGLPVETIEKDNQLALKIPIPTGFFATLPATTTNGSLTATHDKREPLEQSIENATTIRKRKRSAIFIPPMQPDHSSSPSTEVSICKFKFTGGAKPTLQEKKMLSVDAEGNYRYYNGTGDRTMRGYEFISREQQQQQQQQHQPLNPSNDKLYIDIPPPSTDLSLELLHIPPESPTSSLLLSSSLVPVAPQSPSSYSNSHSPVHPQEDCHKRVNATEQPPSPKPVQVVAVKRRSSRRSKQREKLEKTFKEKGFLIQTQQLQSAEGATYCKFRQLKKFTRYLFRNWKDHIPESDLCKHQAKDSGACSQHSVLENILAGQIGLGIDNVLGTVPTAANQAST